MCGTDRIMGQNMYMTCAQWHQGPKRVENRWACPRTATLATTWESYQVDRNVSLVGLIN